MTRCNFAFCAFILLSVGCRGVPVKDSGKSSKPKITYSKDTTVRQGEDVTLDCAVENFDLSVIKGYSIDWRKKAKNENEEDLLISKKKIILPLSDRYEIIHPKDTYQYSLKISKVTEKDHADYLCTIDFGEGQKIEAKVSLMVQVPAFFSDDETKTLRVNEGDSISISCLPGGFPSPEIFWERVNDEDAPFYSGDVFKSDHFDLPLVDRSHKGKYRCHADNRVGAPATSEIIIEVQYKPNIGTPDQKMASTINDKVKLKCYAEGVPLPEVVWMKDGFPIVASSNIDISTDEDSEDETITSTLTIKHLQAEDFGEYTCAGVNSMGSSQQEMELELERPPLIKKQSRGEVLYRLAGELSGRSDNKVKLECLADAAPNPNYRWTKDGNPLFFQASDTYELEEGTGNLIITNPTEKNNGKYRCYAYNKLGVAASDLIAVNNITEISFEEHDPETAYKAELGRPFYIKCPKAKAYPTPKLVWAKSYETEKGLEVEFLKSKSTRVIADPIGYLWFSYVTEEDDTYKNNFKYLCLASTDFNPEDLSLARTIEIETVDPADGKDNIGQEHLNIETFLMYNSKKEEVFESFKKNSLWCIFGGEPTPVVEWAKLDGEPLSDSRFMTENFGQTLVFVDTLPEDTGKYRCRASNGVGPTKEVTFDVDVAITPKFRTELESQSQVVTEGTTVVFSCGLQGTDEATHEWFYNSRELVVAPGSRRELNGSQLIIHAVTVADTGNYACRAKNAVGYAYGQAVLNVLANPTEAGFGHTCSGISRIQSDLSALKTDFQILAQFAKQAVENTRNNSQMMRLISKIANKVVYEDLIESKLDMIEDMSESAAMKPSDNADEKLRKEKPSVPDKKSEPRESVKLKASATKVEPETEIKASAPADEAAKPVKLKDMAMKDEPKTENEPPASADKAAKPKTRGNSKNPTTEQKASDKIEEEPSNQVAKNAEKNSKTKTKETSADSQTRKDDNEEISREADSSSIKHKATQEDPKSSQKQKLKPNAEATNKSARNANKSRMPSKSN